MSSWDAPTGNRGSRQEPDESGRPDEQDIQQGESTGGYGTMRGDEGRLRTGSRSSFNSGPRRALGPGSQVPQASPGSGPNGVVGYGDGGTGAYRRYADDEPTRPGWSDPGQQPGYAGQAGYGDQLGYGSP